MSFYRIKNLGPGLDGMVAEGTPMLADCLYDASPDSGSSPDEDVDMVEVERIYDTNKIMGDRVISQPLARGLFINMNRLDECEDPRLRQFDSKNPWGSCKYEKQYCKGKLQISLAQFERCLQVTIGASLGNTIYSEYFFESYDEVKATIEHAVDNDQEDDLIFQLQEIKLGTTTETSEEE